MVVEGPAEVHDGGGGAVGIHDGGGGAGWGSRWRWRGRLEFTMAVKGQVGVHDGGVEGPVGVHDGSVEGAVGVHDGGERAGWGSRWWCRGQSGHIVGQ